MEPTNFAAPLQVEVPLPSGTITVASAPMGPLLKVKALLLPVLQTLIEAAPELFSDSGQFDRFNAGEDLSAEDIAELCVALEQVDAVVDLVAILAPMPREQVLQLMPDAFAYLFAVVVQVNWDFFVRALPMLRSSVQRIQALQRAAAPLGDTPAASSGTSLSPAPLTR